MISLWHWNTSLARCPSVYPRPPSLLLIDFLVYFTSVSYHMPLTFSRSSKVQSIYIGFSFFSSKFEVIDARSWTSNVPYYLQYFAVCVLPDVLTYSLLLIVNYNLSTHFVRGYFIYFDYTDVGWGFIHQLSYF